MRQGYEIKRIKEICKKGSSNVAQKDLKDCDGEYPIYGASGFIKKVNFFHQEEECIGLVKDGAGVGRVLFLPPQSSVIGTLQYIKPNEGYDIRYIGYCLQSINLSKYSQGATIPHIYFKDYGEEQVVVATDTLEQQRIIDILDAEFAKIDALKENAERNLQNAKDLFQAVLRKELEPKVGWRDITMNDVCELSQGLAINSKTKHLLVNQSDLPLLRIKDLKDGTREIFVNEKECPQSCRAYPDDIIYTRTGTLGLVFTGAYGVMHNNCFKIKIDKTLIDKAFFIYYLQQDTFKDKITQLAKRAAQPDITHKLFKEQAISFPNSMEQASIVAKIQGLEQRCNKLNDNYNVTVKLCNDLKIALLRKAFNGELSKYLT